MREFSNLRGNRLVAMATDVLRFFSRPPPTFLPSFGTIGPKLAKELINGKTEGPNPNYSMILVRAIPFEKLVVGVSGARLKNAAGWSENSSEITAGWSDGPFFALR